MVANIQSTSNLPFIVMRKKMSPPFKNSLVLSCAADMNKPYPLPSLEYDDDHLYP